MKPSTLIARTRKIAFSGIAGFACLLLAGAGAAAGDSPGSAAEGDLQRAGLSQAGQDLIFTVRTASPVQLAKLDRLPAGGGGSPYLCLSLSRAGRGEQRRICLGGKSNTHRRAGLELLNGAGKIASAVDDRRPPETGRPAQAGARRCAPKRPAWRRTATAGWCWRTATAVPRAAARRACPPRARAPYRLRPVRPIGCTGGGSQEAFNGPRSRNVVALTFDDGPSEYTEGFLDVLSREHVHGTFFEIGQEMAGREATMRRILREGDEIGDHTENHVELPDYFQIATAAATIHADTHFQPCLFRPPGGAVNASVIATAGGLGLETILWDVDPADWTTPGATAVYSRIVGAARPGSIILMHDGGGDRSGTLAALPKIIDTLRARGYSFATVSQLLGHRLIYRPYD